MEHIQNPSLTHRQSNFRGSAVGESAQLKSELILLKRKNDRLIKKEKRIQVQWFVIGYCWESLFDLASEI